jgi:hypothetical protein
LSQSKEGKEDAGIKVRELTRKLIFFKEPVLIDRNQCAKLKSSIKWLSLPFLVMQIFKHYDELRGELKRPKK